MSEDSGDTGGRRRTILIVLGIVSALSLVSCVVCGALGTYCASQVEIPHARPREPARYEASLYYGHWEGAGPTTLDVNESSVRWEQQSGSGHMSYNGSFAGISGQDIRVNIMVTEVTLVVSEPPHQDPTTGQWTMTVEGIAMTRR